MKCAIPQCRYMATEDSKLCAVHLEAERVAVQAPGAGVRFDYCDHPACTEEPVTEWEGLKLCEEHGRFALVVQEKQAAARRLLYVGTLGWLLALAGWGWVVLR